MKKYFCLVIVLVSVFFLGGLCGCTDPAEVLRFTAASQENVRIGAVLPLTGPDASHGKKMLNGARFAVDELNSRRGHFGRRVELIVEDTGSTASGAAAAFEKAVRAGAVGIVGGYSTVEARSITALARSHRVPLVIPMATGNNDIIESNAFVFRNVFTDRQQAEMIAGFMVYYRRVKRLAAAVSADPADIYSRNVVRDVTEVFKNLGGEASFVCEVDKKDPQKAWKEALSLMPDAILLPFKGAEAAKYYSTLRQMGYNGLICGPDTWDDPEFFKNLKGIKRPGNNFYTAFFSNEARHMEFSVFRRNFRKKLFYFPESCEIQTFDAVNMLLIGFGNNGENLKKFNKNWLSMRKHAGAAAVYTMEKDNQIDRTIYINRISRAPGEKVRFVPGNIAALQHSRLEDYKVD